MERRRNELVEAVFGMVAQSMDKAVSTLVGLLDSDDERVKRLTANDIVNHFLRHKELHELEKRIEAIEGSLGARGEITPAGASMLFRGRGEGGRPRRGAVSP